MAVFKKYIIYYYEKEDKVARLVKLLLGKLEGFLDQVFLTQGVLGNIKVVIQYLVAADDIEIEDLKSVISLIVSALERGAKELTEYPEEEAEVSYTNVARVLKKQLELVLARIKELEIVLNLVSDTKFIILVDPKLSADDSIVCESTSNDGTSFGPLPDDSPTTDSITFPD